MNPQLVVQSAAVDKDDSSEYEYEEVEEEVEEEEEEESADGDLVANADTNVTVAD